LILKENSSESEENFQLINQLEKQINDLSNQIHQDKTNYINQNLHLTSQYWNDILDLIYQQQTSSYFIKHFYFN
jgi:metal-dependent HD superfamily phosphatase/phosphodiesterase